MATPVAEKNNPRLELPDEALSMLDKAEILGLQFLANHPDTNILIHFSAHNDADDLGDPLLFEEPLGNADIYVHENMGYNRTESQFVLDCFAERRFPHEQLPQVTSAAGDSFQARKMTAIYTSGTHSISADITHDHWLMRQEPSLIQAGAALDAMYSGELPGADETMAERLIEIIAQQQIAREWAILADFGNRLAELAVESEDIAAKLQTGDLNVFMTYGSVHTGLFHKLRQLGLHPERTFPSKPYTYHPAHALLRKKMLAKA